MAIRKLRQTPDTGQGQGQDQSQGQTPQGQQGQGRHAQATLERICAAFKRKYQSGKPPN